MLRSDACFVVLKVSDARKGAEPGGEGRSLPVRTGAERGENFHTLLISERTLWAPLFERENRPRQSNIKKTGSLFSKLNG